MGDHFFTKQARDHRFVSWHQDSTYYGFEPPESITAWIAFSDSTRETGCVRILLGSHKGEAIMRHVETFDPDNLLARGQSIEGVTGTLVRGKDRDGNWMPDISAKMDMDPDCLDALDHAWTNYRKYMKAPYEN